MKVHVAQMGKEVIENYRHVVVSDNYINFMDISDNECEEILANDVLDSFSADKVGECIQTLAKKLRMGGTLVVGGKDVRLFSKAVINGLIPEHEASELVGSVNSMTSLNSFLPVFGQLGLGVLTTQISGMHFEVKATRN